jgi:uncharacterized membrane protein YeaQ/YmgE (transglycosylase-associated protein family)
MENLVGILINSVLGGGGGFLGNMVKKNGLSLLTNVLAGAIGGNVGKVLGGLAGILGDGGDFSIPSILTAVLGGGAGSLIGGLLKKPAA